MVEDADTTNWASYTREQLKDIARNWSKIYPINNLRWFTKLFSINMNGLTCNETQAMRNRWQVAKWAIDERMIEGRYD